VSWKEGGRSLGLLRLELKDEKPYWLSSPSGEKEGGKTGLIPTNTEGKRGGDEEKNRTLPSLFRKEGRKDRNCALQSIRKRLSHFQPTGQRNLGEEGHAFTEKREKGKGRGGKLLLTYLEEGGGGEKKGLEPSPSGGNWRKRRAEVASRAWKKKKRKRTNGGTRRGGETIHSCHSVEKGGGGRRRVFEYGGGMGKGGGKKSPAHCSSLHVKPTARKEKKRGVRDYSESMTSRRKKEENDHHRAFPCAA